MNIMDIKDRLEQLVDNILPKIIRIRQQLHQCPELGFEEFETTQLISETLSEAGIIIHSQFLETGVTAAIDSGKPGKSVLLRADIDALEIAETTQVAYKSLKPGFAHSCGHDGHVACLLGAALVLNAIKDEYTGRIELVFQPAEEPCAGAGKLLEAGYRESLTGKPAACLALHAWPGFDIGTFISKPGYINAGNEWLEITLKGKGGHGARFHETKNPLLGAAKMVPDLYELSAIGQDEDSIVVSIGSIKAGEAANVIPETAILTGTVRTFSEKSRQLIHRQIHDVISRHAEQIGLQYKVEFKNYCPPVYNDEKVHQLFTDAIDTYWGGECYAEMEAPSLGSEDFAFFLEQTPGIIVGLGVGENSVGIHNSEFDFNDQALKYGILLHVLMALSVLANRENDETI